MEAALQFIRVMVQLGIASPRKVPVLCPLVRASRRLVDVFLPVVFLQGSVAARTIKLSGQQTK